MQINYLIEESQYVGKGADTVISLIHNYFKQYSLGEEEIIIHADNCSGQNKNNAMIQYLAWRVLTGKHKRITYSFMVAGHTKFSPDGFFGLFKLKLKNSEVDDLEDLVKVVESSTSGYNNAQTIYDENGERKVSFHNWSEYLRKIFKSLPNILKYHHFIFNQEEPGIVHVKKSIDSELIAIDITNNFTIDAVLEEKYPLGLTPDRKKYILENIIQYVQNPA
jgi:hypothetical protein